MILIVILLLILIKSFVLTLNMFYIFKLQIVIVHIIHKDVAVLPLLTAEFNPHQYHCKSRNKSLLAKLHHYNISQEMLMD